MPDDPLATTTPCTCFNLDWPEASLRCVFPVFPHTSHPTESPQPDLLHKHKRQHSTSRFCNTTGSERGFGTRYPTLESSKSAAPTESGQSSGLNGAVDEAEIEREATALGASDACLERRQSAFCALKSVALQCVFFVVSVRSARFGFSVRAATWGACSGWNWRGLQL